MKTKSIDVTPVLFPIPENGSAFTPENLPSFPVFPVGRNGNYLKIAIPALVIVSEDLIAEEYQQMALILAVRRLMEAEEMEIDGVSVGCVPLASDYPKDDAPSPAMLSRLLRLLSETAQAWANEAAERTDQHCAEDARRASDQILALLAMFRPEALQASPKLIA